VKNYSELTYLQDLCTSPANITGLPALAIPVGYTSHDHFTPNSLPPDVEGVIGEGNDYSEEYSSSESIGGLPLSLQIMSQYGSDKKLIKIGKWLENELDVSRIILPDPS